MDMLILNQPNYLQSHFQPSPPHLLQPQQQFYYETMRSDSDILSTEEYILPLPPVHHHNFPYQQPQPHHVNRFNILDFNRNFPSYKRMNQASGFNFQSIEEEIMNISRQQQQQHQMDSMMASFNGVKVTTRGGREIHEEHIDLTGGSNGSNSAQRRSSFKRHPTVPFGLSQEGNIVHMGLQRSASAQNIHVNPMLAESERNLNYCIRFAVNGLNKTHMSNTPPATNRNIQTGDFGDDSAMIAENSKCVVLGLADGAGGNREIGIDPKKFSRSLLGFCVEIIKNEEIQPHQMAKLATRAVELLENRNIVGSGTLCLLSLNKETNIMTALNMGDSGFRLVRDGKVKHKSTATMAGSSPRQLFVTESRYSGITFVDEREIGRDSDLREFRVKKGDIIVMSSDGLFDVLRDGDIERVVNSHNPKDLQGIADELLQLTTRSYCITNRDDILVMVCRVEMKKGF